MTPHTVSLAQLGMNDEGPVALIEAAAAAGFAGVGLPLRSGALRPLAVEIVGNRPVIAAIRDACRAGGIGIFDVESLVLGHEPPPDALRATFETAAEIGATRISVLGFEPARGPGTLSPGQEAERLAELCATAAEFDLLVGVEFMLFRSIRSLPDALAILRASRAANARIILDALHCHRSGATVAQIVALPPQTVSHLQICDAPATAPPPPDLVEEARNGRLYPGEGAIPLRGMLAALPPDTPLSLEVPVALARGLSVRERASRAAASLAALA